MTKELSIEDKVGIKEIIKVFREAEREGIQQITGSLFEWDDDLKVTGYCNLGILRCKKDKFIPTSNIMHHRVVDPEYTYPGILRLYGLSKEIIKEYYPFGDYGLDVTLDELLFNLNDDKRHGLSFGQTADFLEATFL